MWCATVLHKIPSVLHASPPTALPHPSTRGSSHLPRPPRPHPPHMPHHLFPFLSISSSHRNLLASLPLTSHTLTHRICSEARGGGASPGPLSRSLLTPWFSPLPVLHLLQCNGGSSNTSSGGSRSTMPAATSPTVPTPMSPCYRGACPRRRQSPCYRGCRRGSEEDVEAVDARPFSHSRGGQALVRLPGAAPRLDLPGAAPSPTRAGAAVTLDRCAQVPAHC
jgi:hypothetical protein